MKLKDLILDHLLFGFALLATVSTLLLDTQAAAISTSLLDAKEAEEGEEKERSKVKRYI